MMRISYGIPLDGRGEFEEVGSYGETTPITEIWLLIDGAPVLTLPGTFNRCVASGGSKINTAVLDHTEVENIGNALPLPDEAPMLIFDFDHRRVDWLPQGIGRRAITLHQEGG